MKFILKIFYVFLIFSLLIPSLYIPKDIFASDNRTIASIKADLETQKQELLDNEEQQELTQEEIDTIIANVEVIEADIVTGQNEIIELNTEIAQLEIDIEEKEEEIKRLLNFVQITSGESIYLEYIFNAQSFTDLIYRVSVSEQLTEYNDNLIEEFNQMIADNIAKRFEINEKEQELLVKKEELEVELSKLRTVQDDLSDISVTLLEGIEASEELIETLLADGCYETETVDACYARIKQLPSDTSFWRPTTFGYISSVFGWRSYYYNGELISGYHYGIDISRNEGYPVYASASGQVALVTSQWSGTGNAIFVYHTVNGVNYTTAYFHLQSFAVSEGQNVTKDTIIGYVGNTGQSTGAHLHLSVLSGWAGIDYTFWGDTYYAKNLDPATKIDFPSYQSYFYTRTMNCTLGSC